MKNQNAALNAYNESIAGRKVLQSSNSILVIRPYYQNGLWVFDDERTGLIAEPFVAGADDLLDFILTQKGIREEAKNGFNAVFAKTEFRGADVKLKFKDFAQGGTVYLPENLDGFVNAYGTNEVWLCPALNLYFKDSPEEIFVMVKG